MIKVSNLTYEYPDQLALDNVSFEVERNSITALVGPNGSGKTTLLKCLTALITPYQGEIIIDGHDIIDEPRSVNPIVGYMPDFFGLYDNLEVKQSMQYFAMAHELQVDDLDGHILEILDSVDLLDKKDHKIGSLSRGMRQRMAVAQSMVHKPKLLLLDEPASGLDPGARRALTELFLKLNKMDITIVVSSHILAELDDYATNLIALRNGKIVDKKVGSKEVTDTRTIVINTLKKVNDYLHLIDDLNGFKIQNVKDNTAEIEMKGGQKEQYELLKKLVNKGVEICDFAHRQTKLMDHYDELMKK